MIALKVNDVKAFMNGLFLREAFDDFFLVSLELEMAVFHKIEGKRKKEWYSGEEKPLSEYITWEEIKGQVFSLIKGRKPPLSIKAIFQAGEDLRRRIAVTDKRFEDRDMSLFLNLKFEKGELNLITGASVTDFLLNKELDFLWDEEVRCFLRKAEISFE